MYVIVREQQRKILSVRDSLNDEHFFIRVMLIAVERYFTKNH